MVKRLVIKSLKVREIAERQGYNLDLLARVSGVNFNTTGAIWKGRVANPTLETAIRFARALSVRVEDLCEMEEIEEGPAEVQRRTPALAII